MRTSHSLLAFVLLVSFASSALAADIALSLRYQSETSAGTNRYHRLERKEAWSPSETALIVCDVWDYHHSINAVRRVEELGPRLNEVVKDARQRGVTIIHAPSDCMAAYADHPARKRAIETPKAKAFPKDIQSWCSRIPAEEKVVYPLDQSDGGEDDDPAEHVKWARDLAAMGRKPGNPWLKQSDLIAIDAERDYISDKGEEVWSVLESRGIKNVILTGVHTNMCVLGRPFGLRQMARNGKHVVLMRDMTDTMYNPARWPYVSHFTGNDLIVAHIERHICPTITSDQFIGGTPHRFKHDTRPHLVMVIGEDEYETNQTLPTFAADQLGKAFRVSLVYSDEKNPNSFPGLEVLDTADVGLISVRRRPLSPEQLAIVKRFVAAGKSVVGIRTASHAFSLRSDKAPTGLAAWPEFDAEVFGGHYTGHHGNGLKPAIAVAADAGAELILSGLENCKFPSSGSLYKTSPLAKGTTPLLVGTIEGHPAEPAAWTFKRADDGRSFYTSLGHVDDFKQPEFVRLLLNGLHWAAELPMPEKVPLAAVDKMGGKNPWKLVSLPLPRVQSVTLNPKSIAARWYRCAVRLPQEEIKAARIVLSMPLTNRDVQAWINGQQLTIRSNSEFGIDPHWLQSDDANLLVLRLSGELNGATLFRSPKVVVDHRTIELTGRWQFREGDDPSWSNIPLPAKFGTGPDIYFE